MLVKCLQICAHVFINRSQNCAKTSFRSSAGLWPNFGRSLVKDLVIRTLNSLCPNFGRSRARLCPISFAPCHFPNLAGTLTYSWTYSLYSLALLACPTHLVYSLALLTQSTHCTYSLTILSSITTHSFDSLSVLTLLTWHTVRRNGIRTHGTATGIHSLYWRLLRLLTHQLTRSTHLLYSLALLRRSTHSKTKSKYLTILTCPTHSPYSAHSTHSFDSLYSFGTHSRHFHWHSLTLYSHLLSLLPPPIISSTHSLCFPLACHGWVAAIINQLLSLGLALRMLTTYLPSVEFWLWHPERFHKETPSVRRRFLSTSLYIIPSFLRE